MADSPDRPKRPGGPPKGSRPGSARPAKGKPAPSGRPGREGKGAERPRRDGQGAERPSRDDRPRRDDQQRSERPPRDRERGAERPRRDGKAPERSSRERLGSDRPRRGDDEKRLWTKGGQPARGDSSARERETPEDRDPFGLRSVRERHEAPLIPEDVDPRELDRVARAQLKTLSKENADGVASHLVMVARLIDEDPQLAHEHAISAARRAGRIAVVRETLAITAYMIGDFALALRELRTYRRISGLDDQLPMMVDSERGLGRPEKALELGRSVPRSTLPVPVQVELAIAMSGARLDLGQTEAALAELEIPQLDPDTVFSWSPGLFDAYAVVLEDLGRDEEAARWYGYSNRATAALHAAEAGENDEKEGLEIEIVEEELDVEHGDSLAGEDRQAENREEGSVRD